MKKRRYFFWTLSAFLMILIFSFSAMPAGQSSKISHSLLPLWFSSEHLLRKCAHFILFFSLCGSLFGAFSTYSSFQKKKSFTAFALTALYAASDELHQLFIPGRSGQISDFILDCTGALTFLLLALLLRRWMHHRKNSSSKASG